MGSETWPLGPSIVVFAASALLVAFVGVRMSKVADLLADRIGLGEALFGGVFLGASTSLSGIVTSVTAAASNHPELAYSNAVGGIAAQTFFLAVADVAHRRINLEHAAASFENLIYGSLLVALLAIPLFTAVTPEFTIWSVSPAAPLMILVYLYGLHLVRLGHEKPMWRPTRTRETEPDVPQEEDGTGPSTRSLWGRFAIFAACTAAAGWAIARAGTSITAATGLSESVVGALFTAVATSLPELITTVAAVRLGAPTLAVGGIIGGNAFDTLFLAVSDVAYREGSLFHAVPQDGFFLVTLAILETNVLVLGLLSREKRGLANIGFESVSLVVLYLGGMALLFFMGMGRG
ncbi:sodium:calcium antiporter [Vulgatibacter sp.]|uniref:sodium:calcium antiporter n=1 Tax=Vulgatibacter sp. TaxID=1971226 RepID=UPI00356606C0